MSTYTLDTTALCAFAQELGVREQGNAQAFHALQEAASALHASVVEALAEFHESLDRAGLEHLRIEVSGLSQDAKDYNAWSFALSRGRWRGLILVKLPQRVRLVGPFRVGETEGPCAHIDLQEKTALEAGLSAFLDRFARHAFDPQKRYRKTKRA